MLPNGAEVLGQAISKSGDLSDLVRNGLPSGADGEGLGEYGRNAGGWRSPCNVLLNRSHRRFKRIRFREPVPFDFDLMRFR